MFPLLSYVVLLIAAGRSLHGLALVTLLDVLDDRFRSVDEMQSRLGLPLLTMIQQLQVPESVGLQAFVRACQPDLGRERGIPNPAHRADAHASRCPPDRRDQRRAGRRQDHHDGQPGRLLRSGRQANAADRRRSAAAGADGLDGHARAARPNRGPPLGSRCFAVAPAAHPGPPASKGLDILPSGPRPTDPAELLGGPRFSQLLAWAETVYDLILIDSPPILATSDTAIIGRLVDGVILVVQPVKNRRRLVTRVDGTARADEDSVLGVGRQSNRLGSEHRYYGYHNYGYGYEYG